MNYESILGVTSLSFYGCTSGLRYTRCSFNKENLPQSATLASVFAATAWQPVFISRLNSGPLPNYCYFLYSHANIFPEWWISFWSRMFWRANVFVTDPIMKKKKSLTKTISIFKRSGHLGAVYISPIPRPFHLPQQGMTFIVKTHKVLAIKENVTFDHIQMGTCDSAWNEVEV